MAMQRKLYETLFLKRDGQSRNQRFPGELKYQYAKVDDRKLIDLLSFAQKFAEQVNFFNISPNKIDGNWVSFFENQEIKDLLIYIQNFAEQKNFFDKSTEYINDNWSSFINEALDQIPTKYESFGKYEPHLALYVVFLFLFIYAQNNINGITKRHLDFYYNQVLRLANKEPVSDKVHVLFELKKNVDMQLLKKGTQLTAGKDEKGIELIYTLCNDIVVNKAKITGLKSVFLNKKNSNNKIVYCAPITNSADGIGGELDENNPQWEPFHGKNWVTKAELGFALASPVLLQKEGIRTTTVKLILSKDSFEAQDIELPANAIIVYLTGEKDWIKPKNDVAFDIELISDNSYQMKIEVKLENDEDAVVNYDPKIHGGTFETSSPVMQVMLNNKSDNNVYSLLKNAVLQSVKIDVMADQIQGLTLENDLGLLDPSKPFLPFGPEPVAGSNFYVEYDEAAQKKLTNISLNIIWQNYPESVGDFPGYYSNFGITSTEDFTANLHVKDHMIDSVYLFKKENLKEFVVIPLEEKQSIPFVSEKAKSQQWKINRLSLQNNKWAVNKLKSMNLSGIAGTVSPDTIKTVSKESSAEIRLKKHFIRLELLKSFLHKEYRELFTKTIVEYPFTNPVPSDNPLILPEEPYTPIIESLKLTYTATDETIDLTSSKEDAHLKKEENYLLDELEFFHLSSFGQSREHGFLKNQLNFVEDKQVYLLPQYNNDGEFYIGVEGLEPQQNLSVLFQAAEGSANPEQKKADINWSILSDNHWKPWEKTEILSDSTNSLLTSGIIKFPITKEATNSNMVLPSGSYWLRAAVKENTDAVCRLLDVRTNAVLAEFKDQNNDPEHLRKSLEAGKIKKLVMQNATIKSVEQPYASFGGRIKENDDLFYTRVSERLRHKNRAVTPWDYERIVLENFPSIYKVKCLNHTSPCSRFAPGHVMVIVIPDIINKNEFNPFQPKADLNTLDKIKQFLAGEINTGHGSLTGNFIQLHVENPSYEEVKLEFKVKFHESLDFGYYKEQLNCDIIRFLSPWAFEDAKDIYFGGIIHKSVLIHIIENFDYVDFVTDFQMYQIINENESRNIEIAENSSPRSILVSSTQHNIESV